MTRDEDGPALFAEPLEQVADLADPFGARAVDRLVEEKHAGIAQQGAGDTEALAHAEGERAGPLVCHGAQPTISSTSSTRERRMSLV